jgi:hypothetical protein
VVASLTPRSKPATESRVTEVKRFLRFASTVQAHGRDQGTSTPRSRDPQVTSSKLARASLLGWQHLPEALVPQLHSAASAPEAAAASAPEAAAPRRLGCTKRNPVFAPATVRPNPSLKLTRYGKHCKPGLSHSYYRLSPGLQYLPTRAA